MGMILILLSIIIGILVIALTYKFMAGSWLSVKQFIVAVLSISAAGFWVAFSGLLLIHSALNDVFDNEEI